MTCKACAEARETKRLAIVAQPITKPNPRWLQRFQDKARDMLLQRDFAWASPYDEEKHVGELWAACTDRTDDEIIEQACRAADWMRFKRSKLVIGEPTPVVNAFAGLVHQSSRYEEVKAAVKVERTVPDLEGEAQVARLRNSMPDKCADHLELDALMAENMRLKGQQARESVRQYVKLSQQHAKLTDQTLEGKVRLVSFEPSGKVPLQGEVYKAAIAPFAIQESGAAKQDYRKAAEDARLLAELRREEIQAREERFEEAKLKAKGTGKSEDLEALYAKSSIHPIMCKCGECKSLKAKGSRIGA